MIFGSIDQNVSDTQQPDWKYVIFYVAHIKQSGRFLISASAFVTSRETQKNVWSHWYSDKQTLNVSPF